LIERRGVHDIAAFFSLDSRVRCTPTMSADQRERYARVFFALVPPADVQHALGALGRDVASRMHGRAVPPQNIHLTLAFIGAWPHSGLAALADVGARLVAPAMDVMLDTLGSFRRAGIAWIGMAMPPRDLALLASSLALALAAANVPLEVRRFHPHLTLARKCRGSQPIERAGPYAWQADAMTLLQSQTHPEGALYTSIARWPLGKLRKASE
jgi:2'-5' RNA ligase